jgi:hypothetical protein
MKPDHIIINVHHGSTSESWLVVYPDGRVKYHIENDGWRYANRGAEEHEKWMSMDDIYKLGKSGAYPPSDDRPFYVRVEEAIRKLNEPDELTDEEAEAIEESEDPRGHRGET